VGQRVLSVLAGKRTGVDKPINGGTNRDEPMRLRLAVHRSLQMTGLVLALLVSVAVSAQNIPVLRGGSPDARETATADASPALVTLFNRPIIVLRATVYGFSPAERARAIEARLSELTARGKPKNVTTRQMAEGTLIEFDDEMVMLITPGDVDPMSGQTVETVVQQTMQHLQNAMAAMQEQRSLRYLLRAVAKALAATLLYGAFLWADRRIKLWLWTLVGHGQKVISKTLGHAGATVLPHLQAVYQWIVRITFWILALVATDMWFTYCLNQFPYTAPWGAVLDEYLLMVLRTFGRNVVTSLPGLLVVVVILVVTRLLTKLVRTFFSNVYDRRIHVGWLDPDSAQPTGRVVTFIFWVFAMVMIYPYLPGSGSAAFRGVGVFVGLLVSLGGAGVISQVMGGFVLMYTRSLKAGEYVRIGEHEGTVESVGFMSTRLRTRKNEVINIPNAVLMGTVSANYSRLAEKQGVMVSTTVTIGYDAPWRQVHAMLLRAAEKTTGLRKPPEPFVWQRALSDFYVEYELNVCLEDPEQRFPVLSALCANIQDEFNEHGVQIMSPHFMTNPPQKVWVPKEKWHEPPESQG
jgi:small-conductance mechanosensitive channel